MRPARFFALMGLAAALLPPGARAEKVLTLPSYGYATIVSVSGQDTAKASVTFHQTEEERAAGCFEYKEIETRDDPAAREKLKSDCAAKAKAASPIAEVTRTANCPRRTVRMEPDYMGGASFTLLRNEPDGGYMRTFWRNNRLRQDVMNCLTCGTPEINDSFRVLCPALYRKRFGDLEPF